MKNNNNEMGNNTSLNESIIWRKQKNLGNENMELISTLTFFKKNVRIFDLFKMKSTMKRNRTNVQIQQ